MEDLPSSSYAEERWALVKGGRYAPLASAVAEGLRLDVLAVQPGPIPDGARPRAPGRLRALGRAAARWSGRPGEKGTLKHRARCPLRQLAVRLLDGQGAVFGGMQSAAASRTRSWPTRERFVEDFPPSVLFGTYWLELLPRPPTSLELELTAAVRGAAGRERPAVFTVALPIDESWRLPPGRRVQGRGPRGAAAPAK